LVMDSRRSASRMFPYCSAICNLSCYPAPMPSPYRRSLPRLKAEIVGRVLAGESQRAICGSAGMPCAHTVRNWAASDPLFAADLLDARRRGDWTARFAFDEAKAAAFLARARAGETVNSLIGQPGMPSRGTYTYWNRTLPWFAEAVFALRQRRDAGIGAHGRARRRDFDPALADRVILALRKAAPGTRLEAVLAADAALPCRPVLTRWRREEPDFDAVLRMIFAGRRAMGPRVHEILVEDIVEHIVDGGSFASYSRLAGPSRTTLRRWYRADAGFARAVDEACDKREEMLDFELWLAAERVPPGPVREMTRAVAPIIRRMVRLRHRPGAVHKHPCKSPSQPGSPPARG
jgi:hypothetical protein